MTTVERFLEYLREEKNASDLTLRQYRSSFNRFARFFDPHQPPSTPQAGLGLATQLDIKNFKTWATNNLKPNTVRQTLTYLKAYFNYLVRLGEIPDNPVEHVDPVTVAKSVPKWLNRNEQNALIRAVRGHGNLTELTIICMLMHTGLRVQELCDLRINDVEIGERKGKVIVRKGKWNRYREVPLNKDVRRVLTQYLQEKTDNLSGSLFPSQRSNKMTTRAVQHIIAKYRKLTGIEHLTAHALRHTFGHELVVNKVPLDVVARLMGHIKNNGLPNIKMTLIYTQPGEDDLQRAVEELSWT